MTGEDTISAISTPPGEGGIGIVRISGDNAIEIAEKIFVAAGGKKISELPDKSLIFGHIVEENGEIVDEGILLLMREPKSYTRENVVEIQCHGGSMPVRSVLRRTFEVGARPAERGEFTKRAFLNGRIDLSQAQAVLDVIQSKTSAALKVAQNNLAGQTSKKIREIRGEILNAVAHIEAMTDFPEEDIDELAISEIDEKISAQISNIEKFLENQSTGRILREGLETAIIGKPNVGKSSLLNFLAKTERAIVTDIPGTTRDSIEEFINIGGIPLKIVDTAGIRNSDNVVEKIGIERAKNYAKNAELILAIFDTSRPLTGEDEEIFELLKNRNAIIILNKSDLPQIVPPEKFSNIDAPKISLSIKKGDGTGELLKIISEKVGKIDFESAFVRDEREADLLRRAIKHLSDAKNTITLNIGIDFVSIDLHSALECLSELTGDSVTEDVLNEIFSKFCIGK